MRILNSSFSKTKLILMFALFCLTLSNAQQNKSNQNDKFNKLLKVNFDLKKKKIWENHYKVQIHHGTKEACKKAFQQIKNFSNKESATILYANPSYKLWIGPFRTKIEAQKAYQLLKENHPNALLIKPNNT